MLFRLFLTIDSYFLIVAVITQIFNLIEVLVVLKGIATNEAKAEIEIQPLKAEVKTSMCSF